MGRVSPINKGVKTRQAWRENIAMVEKVGERVVGAKSARVNIDGDENPMPVNSENNIKLD